MDIALFITNQNCKNVGFCEILASICISKPLTRIIYHVYFMYYFQWRGVTYNLSIFQGGRGQNPLFCFWGSQRNGQKVPQNERKQAQSNLLKDVCIKPRGGVSILHQIKEGIYCCYHFKWHQIYFIQRSVFFRK